MINLYYKNNHLYKIKSGKKKRISYDTYKLLNKHNMEYILKNYKGKNIKYYKKIINNIYNNQYGGCCGCPKSVSKLSEYCKDVDKIAKYIHNKDIFQEKRIIIKL